MWDPSNADLTWEVPFDNDCLAWSSSWNSAPLTVGFRFGLDLPITWAPPCPGPRLVLTY